MARTTKIEDTTEVTTEATVEVGGVDESSMEKVEASVTKITDFWATHNLGTRSSLVTFIVAYIATVITTYFTKVPEYVLDTTGWLLFAAFMTVTLGINGVREVGNIIIAVKTGKTRKNDGE